MPGTQPAVDADGKDDLTGQNRLSVPALPRWIAPGETAGTVNLADRRHA